MKSSEFDLPTSDNGISRKPHFPSLLTTPIPDNKTFTPNHHLVSDISLFSEAEPTSRLKKSLNGRSKVPFSKHTLDKPSQYLFNNSEKLSEASKNPQTQHSLPKLNSSEKKILRLRRKYRLPGSENITYDLSSTSLSSSSSCASESDTESEGSLNRVSKNRKSSKKNHKKSSKSSISRSRDATSERIAELKKKQAQLNEDFEKFKLKNHQSIALRESSKIFDNIPKARIDDDIRETYSKKLLSNDKNENCCCRSDGKSSSLEKFNEIKDKNIEDKLEASFSSSQAELKMLEYYRKHEEQIQQLTKQMDELMNIQKGLKSLEDVQSISLPGTQFSNDHSNDFQTRNSNNPFLDNENMKQNHNKVNNSLPKHRSIETMTSFVDDNCLHKNRTDPFREDRNEGDKSRRRSHLNKSTDYLDTSIEKVREDIRKDFDNMSSTPISQKLNSMFVEQGTFYHTPDEKSTNNSYSSKITDNNSETSSKYYSSSSMTPDRTYRTSSPKRYSSKNPFRQTNPFNSLEDGKQTLTRVYHSEQSFYVSKLASKYDVDMNFANMTNYKDLPVASAGTYVYHQKKHCQTIPKSSWNDSYADNDLQKYSLSNMNISVATKKHLEKYGLFDEQNDKKDRRKNKTHNNHDTIHEENEDFSYQSQNDSPRRIQTNHSHDPNSNSHHSKVYNSHHNKHSSHHNRRNDR